MALSPGRLKAGEGLCLECATGNSRAPADNNLYATALQIWLAKVASRALDHLVTLKRFVHLAVEHVNHRGALWSIAVSALLLASCSSPSSADTLGRMNREAKKNGSPYRYRLAQGAPGAPMAGVEKYRVVAPAPVRVPADLGKTAASSELEKDILHHIGLMQREWGGDPSPVPLGANPLPALRGSLKELWFLKYKDGAVRYEVTMTPTGDRVDYSVTGPMD